MWPKKRRSVKLITTAATSKLSTPPLSAVEVAGNTDLITEILVRLPIKSLIKFKSVSKPWLSLISDPKFALLHHSPSHASAAGLFLNCSDEKYNFVDLNTNHSRRPFKSLAIGDDRSGVKIIQSSNGLLLCWNATHPDESRRNFYVFNPTTKHYTTLPPPPRLSRTTVYGSITIYGITLAFDPSKSPHYKAVCVRNFTRDPTKFEIEIYSSETGPWRPSRLGFFEAGFGTLFHRGVFWNGCIHWICRRGDPLRFEVDLERLHPMPMPPVPDSLDSIDRSSGYFGVSGDRLHFVDLFLEPGESRFKVYEMERDYSGWSLKYAVDVSEVSRAFPEMILGHRSCNTNGQMDVRGGYLLSVLCVVRCEIDKESFLVMNIPGCVLRYRFEDGSFCKLLDFPIDERYGMVLKHFDAHQYIESLAFV